MRNKPHVLLVGVTFSELADCALREAFAQVSPRANAEVHVLSTLPMAGEDPLAFVVQPDEWVDWPNGGRAWKPPA